MKIISKKILPEYFGEVLNGNKTFELRRDEDAIQGGDVIILKEWNGHNYTGRNVTVKVTYVLRHVPAYGLMEGYCIIGFKCDKKANCTACILDLTDACPRGAGRAVDDEICKGFLEDDLK